MKKGYFITLEGAEGCGKSTQILLLEKALKDKGLDIVISRSPGGTAVAEKIRDILKEPCPGEDLEPETELLLFGACHSQMTAHLIKPALEQGKILVSDRFYDSTIAYQGYARGLGPEVVERINAYACRSVKPDLTILLDMDPELGIRRAAGRAGGKGLASDRFDSEKMSFHQAVRAAFLKMAEQEKERYAVIDATPSAETVHQKIMEAIHARLGIL